jgi:antiviral helicase SLH1
MWPYDHPLNQVWTLQKDTLYNLRRHADEVEIPILREMEPKELGEMIHMNESHGLAVKTAAQSLPMVDITHALRPLSNDVLEVRITITPTFKWNPKVSTSAEPFYIWIQEETGIDILQWRSVLLRQTTTSIDLDFVLSFEEELPQYLKIVSASDRWLGSGEEKLVQLEGARMPELAPPHTPVLDIPFLNIRCLDDPALEQKYSGYVNTLNGIQTQAFWTFYHTNMNTLLSAPIASGKSLLGEMAIWYILLFAFCDSLH